MAVTIVALTGCPDPDDPGPTEPDYSKPGDNGVTVEAEPVRGAEHHSDRVPPPLGECGATYTALATVRQQVAGCMGLAYGPLYDRAKVEAEYFAAQTECPELCAPPVRWISHHRWGCLDITNPAIASASVEASVMCPLEPYMPESLPQPSDAELTGDGIVGQPTQEPGLFDEIGGMLEVPCGNTELAFYAYHVPVQTCDGVDYQPHVEQAQTLARQYHGSVPCSGDCVRSEFMARRVEWGCEDENDQPTVVVRVLFDVRCTPG